MEPLEPRRMLAATDTTPVAGTWTALSHRPTGGSGTMVLLTDGTVMMQGGGVSKHWYRLSPDSAGNYIDGTWTSLANSSLERLYTGSNVLPNGNLFVLGGEYSGPSGSANWINSGEIYDSANNTWKSITNFPKSQFGDDPTVLLPNGQILAGYLSGVQTYLYTPSTDTWTRTGDKLHGDQSDEETWVMLPDGSVLSYDIFASPSSGPGHAQRYVPSTGTWLDAGSVPVSLSNASVGYEIGPATLLPDGRVFQVGGINTTAFYDPASNTWTAGPSLPEGLGADDSPGVMLPNGHFLFAVDTPLFEGPTRFFNFDPTTNTLTEETPTAQLGSQLAGSAYTGRFLMLPNGHALFNNGGNTLWDYAPSGSAQPAWAPSVDSVATSDGVTYTLTGRQLTGISAGASYGDDAEMDSNYPIVRLTDGAGVIRYARTFNWTPGVATGATQTTVQFTLPTGLSAAGPIALAVIANGIASTSVPFGSRLSVNATNASKSEGNSGSSDFTFTVTRTGIASQASTVQWSVAGTGPTPATADDFAGGVFPSGSLSFAAGEISKTITVNVAGDLAVEQNEGFAVTLSSAVGSQIESSTAAGTIINDDASLAISATSAILAEGDSGSTAFLFTVTRTGSTTAAAAVAWAVTGSGANPTTADDYTGGVLPSGTVMFAAGEQMKTISVSVQGDTIVESDEGFTITLANASGGSIDVATANGTIINDDAATEATVSIVGDVASRAEGNSGLTPFTFTVMRSGAIGSATSVDWAVTGSGANPASGADFTDGIRPTGSLAFAAGETSKTITINVNGDAVVEADEGFLVTLSNVSGGILGTSTAEGLIKNDDIDAAISITAANVTAAEGNAGGKPFAFTVTRSISTAGSSTVNWSVRGSGDFPARGDDFVGGSPPGGTVTFAASETQKTIVVNINGDRDVEANEGFTVLLSDAVGGHIVNASATGTITNDDTELTITTLQSTRPEGNSGSSPATPFTFNVTRFGLTSGSESVRWAVAGSGSAQANAADFVGGTLPSGSISFAAGETSKTITVNVYGDVVTESNEGFTVTLFDATGSQIVAATAAGTILDDDIILQITPQTSSQTEGDAGTTSYVFNVTRSTALASSLTASWKVDGTGPLPANAADFDSGILPSGILTFAIGETSKTITVKVAGDTTFEFDERFSLTVFGDRILTVAASGSIVNDDTGVDITRTPVVKAEGNSGATPYAFTVTRSGPTTEATSVAWTVAGSGAGPADAADFIGGSFPSGTVNFAAGERSKTIAVNVAGDSILEWDEEFTVTLSNASGGSIVSALATGKILNDESAVSITATDANKKEGNSGSTSYTFAVTRLNALAGAAAVTWTVAGSGSFPADAGDFAGRSLRSGTLTFAIGEASRTITVSVAGDTELEFNEGFTVTLSNATGCEIQTATATGTIVSDDAGLAIAATNASQPEGNTGATAFSFVVSRLGATADVAKVAWSVVGSGDSPANAADFTGSFLPGGTVSFAAGETTRTITVLVAGDLLVERDEGFTVLLANASNAKIVTSKASGVILADDTGLRIAATAASANEGNVGTTPFTFTVTRSGQTNIASTVNWSVTGSGTAPADAADFDGGTLTSGTATFAEGETSKVVTVWVAGDVVTELEERFAVTLANAVGGVIETATAIGVIRNDDTSLAISPTSIANTEGNSRSTPFIFTVNRVGVTSGTSTVAWAVVGSGAAQASATDFTDGVLPSGKITFLPGQTSARITVNVSGDRVAEPDEGFTVTLSAATEAQIQSPAALATIVNDDGPVASPSRTSSPAVGTASVAVITPSVRLSATSAAFAQLATSSVTSNAFLRARRARLLG